MSVLLGPVGLVGRDAYGLRWLAVLNLQLTATMAYSHGAVPRSLAPHGIP